MKEKFKLPEEEPDIKRKIRVFFETCSWRELDPLEDQEIQSFCKRHFVSEGDVRALVAELRQEHVGELMEKAKQEDREKKPRRLPKY